MKSSVKIYPRRVNSAPNRAHTLPAELLVFSNIPANEY